MARVLLAWELGAHLGHLGQLVPLARGLRAHGHEPIFALRDVTRAESIAGGFRFVQAPVWPASPRRPATSPCSYPEIMQHHGYDDREGLLAMVKAWRQIYEWIAPHAVVFDHAPTALLASRGLDVVRVQYGAGFSSPPRACPIPSFRAWDAISSTRLESSEARVLDTVNHVLRKSGTPALTMLRELFDVDEDVLCTFPELDHYPAREGGQYCGPVFPSEAGALPHWPEQGTKRICVYLRPEMRAFGVVLDALRALPYSTLWIVPGGDVSSLRRHATSRVRFTDKPVQISRAAAEADAAVLTASHGTTSAMLLAGVPLALFPHQVEQMLMSRNVARLGACRVESAAASAYGVRASIEAVVEDARYRRNAAAFACRYRAFDQQREMNRIAEKISAHCKAIG